MKTIIISLIALQAFIISPASAQVVNCISADRHVIFHRGSGTIHDWTPQPPDLGPKWSLARISNTPKKQIVKVGPSHNFFLKQTKHPGDNNAVAPGEQMRVITKKKS
jgi:hypothetical protein